MGVGTERIVLNTVFKFGAVPTKEIDAIAVMSEAMATARGRPE